MYATIFSADETIRVSPHVIPGRDVTFIEFGDLTLQIEINRAQLQSLQVQIERRLDVLAAMDTTMTVFDSLQKVQP